VSYSTYYRSFVDIMHFMMPEVRRCLGYGAGKVEAAGWIQPISEDDCQLYAFPQSVKEGEWEQVCVVTCRHNNAVVFFDKKYGYYVHKPSANFLVALKEHKLPRPNEPWTQLDAEYDEERAETVEDIFTLRRTSVRQVESKHKSPNGSLDRAYESFTEGLATD
jgi:hypothetical protein